MKRKDIASFYSFMYLTTKAERFYKSLLLILTDNYKLYGKLLHKKTQYARTGMEKKSRAKEPRTVCTSIGMISQT